MNMNKVIAAIFFAVFATSVSAASLTLTSADADFTTAGTVSATDGVVGFEGIEADKGVAFETTYTLTVADAKVGGTNFVFNANTNAGQQAESISLWNGLTKIAFNDDSGSDISVVQLLMNGAYTIIVKGISNSDANFSSHLNIAATPIPAAVWLFGSMLMGFFGLRSRVAK